MSKPMDNLSGNQKRKMRSASRYYAVQALFQMEHSEQSIDKVRNEFIEHRFGEHVDDEQLEDGDINHFTLLLETSVNYQAEIDQLTDRALVAKWPLGRIDPTLRALFRAAGAELAKTEIPPKVIIVEYVDLAAAFSTDIKQTRFVNAVLDHMAHEARDSGF